MACIDHPVVRELVDNITERRVITYGIDSKDAQIVAYNIISDTYSSTFDIRIKQHSASGDTIIEHITIPTPGKHNVLNALAAISIGVELDFGLKVIKNGFKNFRGVKRRFTLVGKYKGAEIIDDYAHHPVEIEATLSTARDVVSKRNGRVISIFQPHRYTRLENLFSDFANCFSKSDKVYILDVFSAGDSPIEGVNSKALVEAINKNSVNAEYLASHEEIASIVAAEAKDGDLVLMMGAGNITTWANQLPEKLEKINTNTVTVN